MAVSGRRPQADAGDAAPRRSREAFPRSCVRDYLAGLAGRDAVRHRLAVERRQRRLGWPTGLLRRNDRGRPPAARQSGGGGGAVGIGDGRPRVPRGRRSEEHTSELQSLMRISYAVSCLKKKIECLIMLVKKKR